MRRIHRDVLKQFGISLQAYILDENGQEIPSHKERDYVAIPQTWGFRIKGPKGTMAIEHGYQQRRWYLKRWPGAEKSYGVYKTQREAVAAYIERLYL